MHNYAVHATEVFEDHNLKRSPSQGAGLMGGAEQNGQPEEGSGMHAEDEARAPALLPLEPGSSPTKEEADRLAGAPAGAPTAEDSLGSPGLLPQPPVLDIQASSGSAGGLKRDSKAEQADREASRKAPSQGGSMSRASLSTSVKSSSRFGPGEPAMAEVVAQAIEMERCGTLAGVPAGVEGFQAAVKSPDTAAPQDNSAAAGQQQAGGQDVAFSTGASQMAAVQGDVQVGQMVSLEEQQRIASQRRQRISGNWDKVRRAVFSGSVKELLLDERYSIVTSTFAQLFPDVSFHRLSSAVPELPWQAGSREPMCIACTEWHSRYPFITIPILCRTLSAQSQCSTTRR